MTPDIETYAPASGRVMREDGSEVNMADMICPLSGGDGEKVLADTTAALLHAGTACKTVFVQNDPDSAGYLKIGFTATPKVKLAPGQGAWFSVTNLNKLYVQAVSTATANYSYQV